MTFVYRPPDVPLEVFYQDENLILVNKPSGLLSVPGRASEHKDCLQSRLEDKFGTALVVHRLDMDTSGVMVFAVDKDAQRDLSKQFESKTVFKNYHCIVNDIVEEEEGEVNLPLRCDWPNRPLQMVDHEHGKPAQTRWKVLERGEGQTRLLLIPITGRSHQLRVHCLSMGHPIVGDRFYAPPAVIALSDRLCLHAAKLEINHPVTGERLSIDAPCDF
ncbi:MAG: RNA pseudouridine synthase [Methylocystaceae bacterium]|nr:RNA pseudouridine synthase [Methylocystaceae bacterium]